MSMVFHCVNNYLNLLNNLWWFHFDSALSKLIVLLFMKITGALFKFWKLDWCCCFIWRLKTRSFTEKLESYLWRNDSVDNLWMCDKLQRLCHVHFEYRNMLMSFLEPKTIIYKPEPNQFVKRVYFAVGLLIMYKITEV